MSEKKPSSKMLKGKALCEEILGVKCEGKSFDEISDFLKENLPKIQGKDVRDYRKPSQKMLNYIEAIEKKTGHVYEGKTMKDASEFIEEYSSEMRKK